MRPTKRLVTVNRRPGSGHPLVVISGLIYQIYANILYVLEYKSSMKITLGWWLHVGFQIGLKNNEPKWP